MPKIQKRIERNGSKTYIIPRGDGTSILVTLLPDSKPKVTQRLQEIWKRRDKEAEEYKRQKGNR